MVFQSISTLTALPTEVSHNPCHTAPCVIQEMTHNPRRVSKKKKQPSSGINIDIKTIPSQIKDSGYYMHNSAGIIFPTDTEMHKERSESRGNQSHKMDTNSYNTVKHLAVIVPYLVNPRNFQLWELIKSILCLSKFRLGFFVLLTNKRVSKM